MGKVYFTTDSSHKVYFRTTSPKLVYFEYSKINATYLKVAAGGGEFSLAIKSDNTGWSWGYNSSGQLGVDSLTGEFSIPTAIYGSHNFCSFAAGSLHSLGLDDSGKIWAWGSDTQGQLGDNDSSPRYTPVLVCGNHTFCSVGSGYFHSLGIDNNKVSWSWGDNGNGQLGNNSITGELTPVSIYNSNIYDFSFLTGAWHHSLGIDKDGIMWSWGDDYYGDLGRGTENQEEHTPVRLYSFVSGEIKFIQAAAGVYFSLGLQNSFGILWSWGSNDYGQLGTNDVICYSSPVPVCGNHTFCSIKSGAYHSIGLDNHGMVFCWGRNLYGQLGDNTVSPRSVPTAVCGNHTFCSIAGGFEHSLGIDNHNIVWSWGRNNRGQLGTNNVTCYSTPTVLS